MAIIIVTDISTGFITVEHAVYWTSTQTAIYLSPTGVRYLTRATANIFPEVNTQHIYPTSYMLRMTDFEKKMYLRTVYCIFY